MRYDIMLMPLLLPLLLFPAALRAGTVRIAAPYIGSITDRCSYPAYRLDMKDSGLLRGLYLQWIDTERFQANAFYYAAPDVNYSRVDGLHLNFDYYLWPSASGKYALGAGLESLRVDMKAARAIPGLDYLGVKNDVLYYYGRAGRYFYVRPGAFEMSALPYAGYAAEKVSGDVYADFPGPGSARADIDDSTSYPVAGLNLDASYRHFAEAQAKWLRRFRPDGPLDDYSLMLNLFLTRNVGLSYRFKYMKETSGAVSYSMAGAAVAF